MLYQRCNAFLNALASEKPVPGGGGACALVAAEGVALGEMVANLTIGKEKYGYFIFPVDLIPDFTPVVGYSDDASAIGLALLLAQMYITEAVKAKARSKMQEIFGETALEKLSEMDFSSLRQILAMRAECFARG